MVKMHTALVFTFLEICGVVCYENTTFHSVHPEQDTYEMQVFYTYSESNVDSYPVETNGEY